MIVVGNVYTSEYEDRDGNRRSSLEIRATSVGPDLARCIVRLENRRHPEPASETVTDESEAGDAADPGTVIDGDESERDTEALPLSA